MIYEANETMRLIGHQNYLGLMGGREEATKKALSEVVQARMSERDGLKFEVYSYLLSIAIDAYIVGFMNGKRAERSKRHRRARD